MRSQNKRIMKIKDNRHRSLRTWVPGESSSELKPANKGSESNALLDLASNDYLSLRRHPALIEAAKKTMDFQGVGAGSSRLITGNFPIHQELEECLSEWLNVESVLLFPSGFQANLAGVAALADRHTIVVADKLIHYSLLLGVKACGAKLKRYRHNDINNLEANLKQAIGSERKEKILVITESLFSMEGTNPPLNKISQLCEEYSAKLLVDEAHALGIMGEKGKGLCSQLTNKPNIISGTFGKAFGSGGAFLASNSQTREHLLQNSGEFRYTTALAPPLCAAALAALKLIESHPNWGMQLIEESQYWRSQIEASGWQRPRGNGPILPLIIGSDEKTLFYQNLLEKNGLISLAIRPPTVPEDSSRLRIVLRKGLPDIALKRLLTCLKER